MKLCPSCPPFQWKEKKKRFKDHEVMAVHLKENVRLGHTSLRAAAKAVRLRNASLRDRISFTTIYEVI
jgi:hypothetical protein